MGKINHNGIIANLKEPPKDNCYYCGKEFEVDLRSRKRGWGLFCSKSCSSKFTQKDKTKQEIRQYKLKKLNITDE